VLKALAMKQKDMRIAGALLADLTAIQLAFCLESKKLPLMTLLEIGGDQLNTAKRLARRQTVSVARATLVAQVEQAEKQWHDRLLRLLDVGDCLS
jgi:hypothetical protein